MGRDGAVSRQFYIQNIDSYIEVENENKDCNESKGGFRVANRWICPSFYNLILAVTMTVSRSIQSDPGIQNGNIRTPFTLNTY